MLNLHIAKNRLWFTTLAITIRKQHMSKCQICFAGTGSVSYQVSLPKVIGTDDIHRDEIVVLQCQLSQLVDEARGCGLAQNLVHLLIRHERN